MVRKVGDAGRLFLQAISRSPNTDPTSSSTPQLPFERPQIPSHKDHQALNRGTLGGAGRETTKAY